MFVRSEFSMREAFGPMEEVVARLPSYGGVIADWGCWGHVAFTLACEKAGKAPVLGSRVRLVEALEAPTGRDLILVPKDAAGLRNLYQSVSVAYLQKLYVPRLLKAQLPEGCRTFDQGQIFSAAGRSFHSAELASCDNFFPAVGDRRTWQVMLGRFARSRPGPMHITSEDELKAEGASKEQLSAMRSLVESCNTPLPKAENIRFGKSDPDKLLAQLCWKELAKRGLNNPRYAERLEYELNLIKDKKFADYFLVISDMIQYAKQHMLVGPARGSSAGSLVCWLSRITEVDPIHHGLIFERFVDVNRLDLPDIDIDFPDLKRHMVVEYLAEKYGQHNVAHIGTVIRYKPKSSLTDVAKELNVPLWELDQLKDVLIERSSGDSRAGMCLLDSINQLDVGRALIIKYPELAIASRFEEHAKTVGKHAAGIVVCNGDIKNYCVVAEDITQADKKMAEKLNMLKIDALGLRTLTVVEEACALAHTDPYSLYEVPLEDPKVFEVFNQRRYAGIFQFEGIALQGIANQTLFDRFDDIVAITALARPGPLSSGEANNWIRRKMGLDPIVFLHPMLRRYTEETYGCIIYQEQVMKITREIGGFSWADTASVRKLMSAREGDEKFGRFEKQFIRGAHNNDVKQVDAVKIWKAINTFGSWAFNKSHAVAYGLLSYWTAWLKAYHPLHLIVAGLRHAKDDEGTLSLLREAVKEGFKYVPFDPVRSEDTWTVQNGELLGGLLCLPGVGAKTAKDIMIRRGNGMKLTPRQNKLLQGTSKFAEPFPTRQRYGHIYDDPSAHLQNVSRVNFIEEIDINSPDETWVAIGKLVKKNLRDLNENKYVTRRGGRKVAEDLKDFLLFYIEDDTGRLLCCIRARQFQKLGKPLVESAALGQWLAVRGRVPGSFKMLEVNGVKWL